MRHKVHVINWNVTEKCNLQCRYCFAAARQQKSPTELTTKEGLLLIREIRRTFGKIKVTLGNAEPLTRGDVLDFVEYGSKLGLSMALATNGILFSEKRAMQFKQAGLKEVTLPIDGVRKTNDKLRGEGSFEAALRAVEAAKNAKLNNIVINSCISKLNITELPQILDMCIKWGVKRSEIFHYIPMGRGPENFSDMALDEKQFVQSLFSIYEEQNRRRELEIYPTTACQYWVILNQKFKKGGFVPEYFFKMDPGCGAGISMFSIKPNGDVTACPMLESYVGNVRETSLKKLWHSEAFEKLRLREVKGRCAICKYKNICMGCRVRAFIHYKDFLAEDPLCGFFKLKSE